jgi:spermidine synthase
MMPGVARELRRVQVNSIDDIAVRRLGGKASLAPMFASYGVPANSDYYPYLDLHAAKYRFLHQSADELTGLLSYSVPVVALLEGRKSETREAKGEAQDYLEALEVARRASYARDYLLSPKHPEPVAIPRQFQKDLELARARLIECRDVGRSDIWFQSLYELARTLNPMLSPAEARSVWDRIERAPCSSQFTAEERQWIGLMKAVGDRSAPDMAKGAEALLAKSSDLPGSNRQYLIAAGMSGYLAQGKRAEAAALWNRYPADADRAGDVGLRLLHAHAFATAQ